MTKMIIISFWCYGIQISLRSLLSSLQNRLIFRFGSSCFGGQSVRNLPFVLPRRMIEHWKSSLPRLLLAANCSVLLQFNYMSLLSTFYSSWPVAWLPFCFYVFPHQVRSTPFYPWSNCSFLRSCRTFSFLWLALYCGYTCLRSTRFRRVLPVCTLGWRRNREEVCE